MAIDLSPGSTWQTTIDANQDADELFIGKSGTHLQQTANIRPGQTLLMEDGCVLDGQFALATFFNALANNAHGAEIGSWFNIGPDPPVIHSYAPGNQQSVFDLISGSLAIRDVVLHGFILRDSFSGVSEELGWGVDMGERTTLLRLEISGIGKAGVNWSGANGVTFGTTSAFQDYTTAGGTVDTCWMHHNGRAGADTGAISKIVHGGKGRVIKNSRFNNNRRANIWCDFLGRFKDGSKEGQFGQWDTGWLEIVQCELDNVGPEGSDQNEALFLEVTSGVRVHHNLFHTNQSNGGSGLDGAHIIVHNGAFCIIEDNVIFDCGVHSMGIQQSGRYDTSGRLHTCESIIFRRNTIYVIDTAVNQVSGIGQVAGGPPFDLIEGSGAGDWDSYLHGNNEIDENHYKVLDTRHNQLGGALFHIGGQGGDMTFEDWQAKGFDVNGTYDVLTAAELPSEPPPVPSLSTGDFRYAAERIAMRANPLGFVRSSAGIHAGRR